MNALSKNWLLGAISVCAALAGLVLLVAVAASGDAIGRSVTTLIGAGFAFGVLGCGLKQIVLRRGYEVHPALRVWPASYAPVPVAIVATPRGVDATASEFDDSRQPSFAPVASLTEAQVERQRAERRRQERLAEQTRA